MEALQWRPKDVPGAKRSIERSISKVFLFCLSCWWGSLWLHDWGWVFVRFAVFEVPSTSWVSWQFGSDGSNVACWSAGFWFRYTLRDRPTDPQTSRMGGTKISYSNWGGLTESTSSLSNPITTSCGTCGCSAMPLKFYWTRRDSFEHCAEGCVSFSASCTRAIWPWQCSCSDAAGHYLFILCLLSAWTWCWFSPAGHRAMSQDLGLFVGL